MLLPHCVTLGKLLALSGLPLPHLHTEGLALNSKAHLTLGPSSRWGLAAGPPSSACSWVGPTPRGLSWME